MLTFFLTAIRRSHRFPFTRDTEFRMNPEEKNLGLQPLDALLDELQLKNPDLVAASTEQLTHKQVQKGRRGRRLTGNIQRKIVTALNTLHPERQFSVGDLFNYRPSPNHGETGA
jgi:hypothetical protein